MLVACGVLGQDEDVLLAQADTYPLDAATSQRPPAPGTAVRTGRHAYCMLTGMGVDGIDATPLGWQARLALMVARAAQVTIHGMHVRLEDDDDHDHAVRAVGLTLGGLQASATAPAAAMAVEAAAPAAPAAADRLTKVRAGGRTHGAGPHGLTPGASHRVWPARDARRPGLVHGCGRPETDGTSRARMGPRMPRRVCPAC
jgi:hypothetical protein